MRVDILGEGTPEVAIVGALHGDEPCGVRAIDRLIEDHPVLERAVKLIVANEEALEQNVRYIDADLNRSFDGAPFPGSNEHRLAELLADELRGMTALAIHSTQSTDEPFGIVNGLEGPMADIAPFLSITALVDVDQPEGRIFALEADFIEVEAGRQGSDQAAENAYRIAREFLTATGALPGQTVGREVPVFRLDDRIDKPTAEAYEVFVENFSRVESGETFAAADGEPVVADEAFYPILLSPYGYADQFGFAGQRVGSLSGTDARSMG